MWRSRRTTSGRRSRAIAIAEAKLSASPTIWIEGSASKTLRIALRIRSESSATRTVCDMESLGQQQGAANHTTITPAGGVDSRGLAVLVLCRATTQEKPACPQPHADNLARLIEMLAAAAEYAERSGGTLGEECLL